MRYLADGGSTPLMTWYGDDGERIELSGRWLGNWVAKAANLLQDELDLQPGDELELDLPDGHWRGAYWILAAAWLGLSVERGAGVLVTADPARAVGRDQVVLVTLPALARAATTLPAGAIDEAAELASYGDTLPPAYDLRVDRVDGPPAGRVLLNASPTTWEDAQAVWRAAGSVVVVPAHVDPARAAEISAVEKVTHSEQ